MRVTRCTWRVQRATRQSELCSLFTRKVPGTRSTCWVLRGLKGHGRRETEVLRSSEGRRVKMAGMIWGNRMGTVSALAFGNGHAAPVYQGKLTSRS